eukprot:2882635-Rhodomonas_salina.1
MHSKGKPANSCLSLIPGFSGADNGGLKAATQDRSAETDFWVGWILTMRRIRTHENRSLAMYSASTTHLSLGKPNDRIV